MLFLAIAGNTTADHWRAAAEVLRSVAPGGRQPPVLRLLGWGADVKSSREALSDEINIEVVEIYGPATRLDLLANVRVISASELVDSNSSPEVASIMVSDLLNGRFREELA